MRIIKIDTYLEHNREYLKDIVANLFFGFSAISVVKIFHCNYFYFRPIKSVLEKSNGRSYINIFKDLYIIFKVYQNNKHVYVAILFGDYDTEPNVMYTWITNNDFDLIDEIRL